MIFSGKCSLQNNKFFIDRYRDSLRHLCPIVFYSSITDGFWLLIWQLPSRSVHFQSIKWITVPSSEAEVLFTFVFVFDGNYCRTSCKQNTHRLTCAPPVASYGKAPSNITNVTFLLCSTVLKVHSRPPLGGQPAVFGKWNQTWLVKES